MGFNKGDRVLCINDCIDADKALEILKDFQTWVIKDNEYIIREVLLNDGIVVGLLLEGVYNMPIYIRLLGRKQEPAFGTFRFRKLKKNSSEIFEEESEEVLDKVHELLKIS